MTGAACAAGRARVGCSGWVYRDWRGPVYPADLGQAAWLGHYAALFDTVELNTTFYRLPTVAAVERWAGGVPSGFTFALKLGAFGTHRKKLRDPAPWLARHVDTFAALGAARGPCLVQLPPRWRRDPDRLDAFLAATPPDWRWAVEVRDASWLHDDVFTVLERHGAALCVHDLLPAHPQLLTARWTYVRFHGPGGPDAPYAGEYGTRRLHRRAAWIAEVVAEGCDAYAYFNNDGAAAAVADARRLRRLLGVPGPYRAAA